MEGGIKLEQTKAVAVHQVKEVTAEEFDALAMTANLKGVGAGVLRPTDLIPRVWSYSVLALDFVYSAFLLPIVIAFVLDNHLTDGEGTEWLRSIHWLAGAVFTVDILVKLNTGVVVSGPGREMLLMDRGSILRHWALGVQSVVDVLSVLPFIYEVFAVRDTIGDDVDQYLSVLRLARLIYVTRFSIWIYMKCLSGWYPEASLWDRIPRMSLLNIIMMHSVLGIINLMGCVLYAIGRWEGERNSWVQARGDAVDDGYHIDTKLPDAGQVRKYLDSVFWAADTWTTVGFGNPAPVTWIEQLMVLLIEYLFIFFFSLTAALFGNVLTQIHESHTPKEFKTKMGNLASWLDSRRLRYDVRMKVKLFYLGLWSKESGFQSEELVTEIPTDIREELLTVKVLPIIKDTAFLKNLSNEVQEALALKMVPKSVAAGDVVFSKGMPADSFFLVDTGNVRVRSSSGSAHQLGPFEAFGLCSILGTTTEALAKRQTDAVALTNCTIWEIKVENVPSDAALAVGVWNYISGNNETMAIELGVSPTADNVRATKDISLGERFNAAISDVLFQQPSAPVLGNQPIAEGIYDPTDLGIFQPSIRQVRVDAATWGEHVADVQSKPSRGAPIDPTCRLSVYWSWFTALFDIIFSVCVLPPIIQFVIDNHNKKYVEVGDEYVVLGLDDALPDGAGNVVEYDIVDGHGWGRALLWIAGIVYLLEMLSGMFTGFVVTHSNKALVVRDWDKVLEYYVTTGGFWVDIISVLPFIYEIFAVHDIVGDKADEVLNILRLCARYVRVAWILKEVYIHSIINHWSMPTYPFFDRLQPTLVYFGYVFYTVFGVITFFGAMLYCIAKWRGFHESWIHLREHLPESVPGIVDTSDGATCENCHSLLIGDEKYGPSEWIHYNAGLFFAFDVLLTNGNGEPHPVTWNEEIGSLIIMVFQVFFFGFVIGATLDLFKSARNIVERADNNKLKMKSIESFFLTRKLPKKLQSIVQSFYTEVWSRVIDFDEAEILDGLPMHIRQEIVFEILKPVYKKMELFEKFTDDVLLTMSGHVQPSLCARDCVLYAEGEIADMLYLLEFGSVIATENEANYAKIRGPSTIGEEMIMAKDGTPATREYTVETRTSCFLWTLSADALNSIEEEHNGTKGQLVAILNNMQQGGASEISIPGGPLKKRTSSLRRIMSEKSVGSTNMRPMYEEETLPPTAYQPRTFDVTACEWFRLMNVPENERKSPMVINPQSLLALYSSWFMFVFDATYTAFVMPALVAFVTRDEDERLLDWGFAVEVIAGLVFLTSMIINLMTGYVAQYDHRSTAVMRRSDVLKNYVLRGGFWIDLASVLPLFYEIIARADGGSGDALIVLTVLRMLRMIRVFRVLQMIWNLSFSVSTRQLGWMLRPPSALVQILKAPTALWIFNVFYVFAFCSNLCGAILYIVGKYEGIDIPGDRSWINMRVLPTNDGHLLANERTIVRYLHSVYWAMDTITTLGFGDPWPNTWEEEFTCIFIFFINVLLFSVIFASTSTVIKSLREDVRRLDSLRTCMNQVVQWMQDRGFSPAVQKMIRSYYSDKINTRDNLDNELLADMPVGIRSSVLQYVTQGMMNNLVIFKNMDRARKEMIAGRLMPVTLATGHDLYSHEDLPNGVYFLEAGTVTAIRENEELSRVSGPAVLGVHALVDSGEPRAVTVRADTPCYFWHLETSALDELCSIDSRLRLDLVGSNDRSMRTAWAMKDGEFLDVNSGGVMKSGKHKLLSGPTAFRYSLRNVVRYHEVSGDKWGRLQAQGQGYSDTQDEAFFKTDKPKSGFQVPFSPDGFLAIAWSSKMLFFDATYTAFLLPVVLAFGLGKDYNNVIKENGEIVDVYGAEVERELKLLWWVHVFEWWAGIVLIVNLFMNLTTGFVAKNQQQKVIVRDFGAVVENYGWRIVVDILSILPFFMYLAALGGATGPGAKAAYVWLLVLRFVPRFWLFLMDLGTTCFAGSNAFPILVDYMPNSTFYFILTIYVTAVTFNVFGCAYFFTAVWRAGRPNDSWVALRGTFDGDLFVAGSDRQYLDSIYWCSDTLTTVGYGDPQPTTWEEMLVAMAIMIFMIYFMILIESSVSELLRDTSEKEEFRKMKAAKNNWMLKLMGSWGIPTAIQEQVVGYYQDKWARTKAFDEEGLMNELPNTLRTQVALEMKG